MYILCRKCSMMCHLRKRDRVRVKVSESGNEEYNEEEQRNDQGKNNKHQTSNTSKLL